MVMRIFLKETTWIVPPGVLTVSQVHTVTRGGGGGGGGETWKVNWTMIEKKL